MPAILMALLALQIELRDPATFTRRTAELQSAAAQRASATAPDARARATVSWLEALRRVLETLPCDRTGERYREWTDANDAAIVFNEIGCNWMVSRELLAGLHSEHAGSAVADDIAWFAVTNGLGGECEGFVPCYADRLNTLYGDYLRASPRGAHRQEVFDGIAARLKMVVKDLGDDPNASAFFDVTKHCDDLLQSMREIRTAVATAGGGRTEAIALVDRVIAYCPSAKH